MSLGDKVIRIFRMHNSSTAGTQTWTQTGTNVLQPLNNTIQNSWGKIGEGYYVPETAEVPKKTPSTFKCAYCGSTYVRPEEGKIKCPGCSAPPSDEDIYMAGFNDGFEYGKVDISGGRFHKEQENVWSTDGWSILSSDSQWTTNITS